MVKRLSDFGRRLALMLSSNGGEPRPEQWWANREEARAIACYIENSALRRRGVSPLRHREAR